MTSEKAAQVGALVSAMACVKQLKVREGQTPSAIRSGIRPAHLRSPDAIERESRGSVAVRSWHL